MTSLMKIARNGNFTEEMKIVANMEQVDLEFIRRGIAKWRMVIPKSNIRELNKPIGIGKGLLVKVNTNVGSSKKVCNIPNEIEKAKMAVKFSADIVMDLSTGMTKNDIQAIRKQILNEVKVLLGTVPIYQTALRALENKGAMIHFNEDDLFNVIEEQANEGVDFFTIHVGVTKEIINYIKEHPRILGMVSRGGTFLAAWILENDLENPFYKNYDYLLEMAKKYDFILSIGDGCRSGSIFDASDFIQIQELLEISKLVKRARDADVQVIVEGPGHMPANQIEGHIKLQKSLCDEAPFYLLGPLVTDIAPGYDEIAYAIGGVIAGLAGVDYLCDLTPSEHLALPTIEEIKRGTIASKIAAHAVNIAKYGRRASSWDYKIDMARKNLDWNEMIKLSIDSELAKKIHFREGITEEDTIVCVVNFVQLKL